jgi:hypothetical protein
MKPRSPFGYRGLPTRKPAVARELSGWTRLCITAVRNRVKSAKKSVAAEGKLANTK